MQHLKSVEFLSFKPSLSCVCLSPARTTSSSEKGKVKVCMGMKGSHLIMFCLMIHPWEQIKSMLIRDVNTHSPLLSRKWRMNSFKCPSGEAEMKVRRAAEDTMCEPTWNLKGEDLQRSSWQWVTGNTSRAESLKRCPWSNSMAWGQCCAPDMLPCWGASTSTGEPDWMRTTGEELLLQSEQKDGNEFKHTPGGHIQRQP